MQTTGSGKILGLPNGYTNAFPGEIRFLGAGTNRPDAGEPSLGIDWLTGNVMYMAGDQVTRLTYPKGNPRGKPTATNVTPSGPGATSALLVLSPRRNVTGTVSSCTWSA